MADRTVESIKVIVVGDGNVGKTSMLRRFVRGDFIEQYRRTIGAEFMEKDVFLRSTNATVKLMLWDTAGQEVFNSLTQAYYRGAAAAIVAFSTVDRESFIHAETWKERVEAVCGPITTVLCQTKYDLLQDSVLTNEETEQLAERLRVPFFRVSTKDDFNVTQLFEFTAEQCVEAISQAQQAPQPWCTPVTTAGPMSPEATKSVEVGNAAEDGKHVSHHKKHRRTADAAQKDAASMIPSVAGPQAVVDAGGLPNAVVPVEDGANATTSTTARPPVAGEPGQDASGGRKTVNLNEPSTHKAKKRRKIKCSIG